MTARERLLIRKLNAIFAAFTPKEIKAVLHPWSDAVTISNLRSLRDFLEDLEAVKIQAMPKAPKRPKTSGRPKLPLGALEKAADSEARSDERKPKADLSREFRRWLEVIGSVNERDDRSSGTDLVARRPPRTKR